MGKQKGSQSVQELTSPHLLVLQISVVTLKLTRIQPAHPHLVPVRTVNWIHQFRFRDYRFGTQKQFD